MNLVLPVMSIDTQILETLPFLKELPPAALSAFGNLMITKDFEQGVSIYSEGDRCIYMAFVLSGSVRIYKSSEGTREITLYRIGPGQSCILTTSCLLSDRRFSAKSITEEDSTIVLIPSEIFLDWFNRYDAWRQYVFDLLSSRLNEVIDVVEEVVFRRLDSRIADYLYNKYLPDNLSLKITHAEIASELGTSREVVSRILKDFERLGLLTQHRGIISLLKPDMLNKDFA